MWRDQGTNGEEDIGEVPTGTEPDGGNANRQKDARYDPAILFSEIKADDWRIFGDPPDDVDAEGVDHPAITDFGLIKFFEPVPSSGHSNFSGDKGGAKAPWPCRLVKMSIEVESPPTPGLTQLPLSGEFPPELYIPFFGPPVGAVWADIIVRGRFTETLGDIPVLKDLPVSQIGAAGGATYDLGGSFCGTGHNQVPERRNGFPRPDELVLTPDSGNGLKAWIALNPADVPLLGAVNDDPEKGMPGWGSPLPPVNMPVYRAGDPGIWSVALVNLPYRAVKLNYFGQRGINIRAGKGSVSSAVAQTR